MKQVQGDLDKVMAKLANPQFREKAPQNIVEKEKGKQSELETTLEKLQNNLESMK